MEDKQQEVKEIKEKKKTDVFSIFTKEKIIKFETATEYITILMKKMTQGDRRYIIDEYYNDLEKNKNELIKSEEETHFIRNSIKKYNKDDLIKNLINYEKNDRLKLSYLLPKFDKLNDEEKEKAVQIEIVAWEKDRTIELNKKDIEDIYKTFIDNTIEFKSLVKASDILNYNTLVKICFDEYGKVHIFKSLDDIFKIVDKDILNWLLEELEKFREFETKEKVKEVAESGDFLDSGQSQKS